MSKAKAPGVGDIVHYTPANQPDAHCAALVIGVTSTSIVNLSVFFDAPMYGSGPCYVATVPHDEAALPHTWHWPEKV